MTKRYIPIQANTRRFSWNHRGYYGWFQPNGRLAQVGDVETMCRNPASFESDKPLYAARIFVGFNVDDEPRWGMDDLVKIVKRVRMEQVDDAGATFLHQRGIYVHKHKKDEETGERIIADEDGAQVIIINFPEFHSKRKEFEKQMYELAETIATELLQEIVILEIQKGGVTVKTVGMEGIE